MITITPSKNVQILLKGQLTLMFGGYHVHVVCKWPVSQGPIKLHLQGAADLNPARIGINKQVLITYIDHRKYSREILANMTQNSLHWEVQYYLFTAASKQISQEFSDGYLQGLKVCSETYFFRVDNTLIVFG